MYSLPEYITSAQNVNEHIPFWPLTAIIFWLGAHCLTYTA